MTLLSVDLGYSCTFQNPGIFLLLVNSDLLKSICLLEIPLSGLGSMVFKICVNLVVL